MDYYIAVRINKTQYEITWANLTNEIRKKKANIKERLLYDFVFITYNTGKVLQKSVKKS